MNAARLREPLPKNAGNSTFADGGTLFLDEIGDMSSGYSSESASRSWKSNSLPGSEAEN